MSNKKQLQKMQAIARARAASDLAAYDFLEEQEEISREVELLKFKRESRITDDGGMEIDFEDMQTLFDRVA